MEDDKKLDFSVKALIIRKGKFLVMHKVGVEDDLWELPGGRMEFGEKAEDTVERELKEETGLKVKPIRILDTWDLIRGNYQITGIIYLCSLEEGEVTLSHEHDDCKWINADNKSIDTIYDTFKSKMVNWNWASIIKESIESEKAYKK